jgi:general secretion pathway protein I
VRRARRQGGFTLLEVMVALAVLAGALMAVADLSGSALRNFGYARDLSVATLLARGKIAELEEKYEDQGFTDFDETEEGNFGDQGQPGMRWKLELRRPGAGLSAEQILGAFLGAGEGDVGTQELLGKLLGSQNPGAGGKGGPTSGLPGGVTGSVLQTQINAFAEELKKGVRQVTLRISWKDGKIDQGFDLSTYWVVLNPKAPGGARGPNPDVPPNLGGPPPVSRLPGAPVPGQRQPAPSGPRTLRPPPRTTP